MKQVVIIGICLGLASPALAQTYRPELSRDDVAIIGAGLDKLPREITDRNHLFDRMQKMINDTDAAAQKAATDAADQIVAKKQDEIVSSFLAKFEAAILAKIAADKTPIIIPTPTASPTPEPGAKK